MQIEDDELEIKPRDKRKQRKRTKSKEKAVDFNNIYFKLIAAVRVRDNLWDTKNEHYRCKWKRDKTWADVSKLFNLPGNGET